VRQDRKGSNPNTTLFCSIHYLGNARGSLLVTDYNGHTNEDFKLQKPGLKPRHRAHSSPSQRPIPSIPGSLSWGHSERGVKSTTHLHLRQSLGISGAINPLPSICHHGVDRDRTLFFNTSVKTQKSDTFSYLIGFDQASWSPASTRDCG